MSPPSIPVEVGNDEKEAQHNELRWLSRVEKEKECRGELGIWETGGGRFEQQNDNAECGRLRKWALENWRTRKSGTVTSKDRAKRNVGGLCFTSISNAKCWSLAKANQQGRPNKGMGGGSCEEKEDTERTYPRRSTDPETASTLEGTGGCGKTLGYQIWVQSATRWVRRADEDGLLETTRETELSSQKGLARNLFPAEIPVMMLTPDLKHQSLLQRA
jgi:hypothetical protein